MPTGSSLPQDEKPNKTTNNKIKNLDSCFTTVFRLKLLMDKDIDFSPTRACFCEFFTWIERNPVYLQKNKK
jgi:hypothetical protein